MSISGFLRVGCICPEIHSGDPTGNAELCLSAVEKAVKKGAALLVLPENCFTGNCGSLADFSSLQRASEKALTHFLDKTSKWNCAFYINGSFYYKGVQIDGEFVADGYGISCSDEGNLKIIVEETPTMVGFEEDRKEGLSLLSRNRGLLWVNSRQIATTDGVYGGGCALFEDGKKVDGLPLFADKDWFVADLDLDVLPSRKPGDSAVELPCPDTLKRSLSSHPFYPDEKASLNKYCEQVLQLQSQALAQRMNWVHAKTLVLGISGGLDSTLALLVSVRAMDLCNRPHSDVIAVTMPCYGTTQRTKSNATLLCENLGTDFRCIPIGDSVSVHLSAIGHDENNHNVTYENAQARERTQVLMDIANDNGGFVVGTGDLSELALGWATYNGDHMSMYGVNAGVPKTVIRQVVTYESARYRTLKKNAVAECLLDIVDTPVSPELLPPTKDGTIAQVTEDLVGPYEIHDFYLYYFLKYGTSPKKLYEMAQVALGKKYTKDVLKHWLENFFRRFFSAQFKRNCLPDGPAVLGLSLSPRGAWTMPSDMSNSAWMEEIKEL